MFGLDTWSVWLGWVEAIAISRTTKHASNQKMQFDKTERDQMEHEYRYKYK